MLETHFINFHNSATHLHYQIFRIDKKDAIYFDEIFILVLMSVITVHLAHGLIEMLPKLLFIVNKHEKLCSHKQVHQDLCRILIATFEICNANCAGYISGSLSLVLVVSFEQLSIANITD